MAKKPGKYDHLLPKLPKTHGTDDSYQARVEVEKANLRKCTTCKGVGHHRQPLETTVDAEVSCGDCNGTGRRKLTADLIATLYAKQRAEKDIVELALSQINCELEALTQLLIASQEQAEPGWGAFGAADNQLRLTSGDAVRTNPEIYPVVFDKNAFRDWLVARTSTPEEPEQFLRQRIEAFARDPLTSKLTLPPKALTDMVKDRLLRGQPEPDGVKVFVKTKVTFSPLQTETVSQDSDVAEVDATF